MAEIQRISHTHDQVMDWLIANPARKLSECAAEFGYTQSWLSQIVHSDCFQARLRERQDAVFGEVALTVKDRITALAHSSLSKLNDILDKTTSEQTVLDATELSLKALGFTPARSLPGGNTYVQQNIVAGSVDRETLANARALMDRSQALLPAPEVSSPG